MGGEAAPKPESNRELLARFFEEGRIAVERAPLFAESPPPLAP